MYMMYLMYEAITESGIRNTTRDGVVSLLEWEDPENGILVRKKSGIQRCITGRMRNSPIHQERKSEGRGEGLYLTHNKLVNVRFAYIVKNRTSFWWHFRL